MKPSMRPARAAVGFSLVEVLVSIAVLGVGLLGAAGMLLHAVRASTEAATFAAAVNLVRELSEKLRLNARVVHGDGSGGRGGGAAAYLIPYWTAAAGEGEAGGGENCVLAGTACDAQALARWDVHEWKRRVARTLPGARLRVCFDDRPGGAAAGGAAEWACSGRGERLVAKLGWTPRNDDGTAGRGETPAPPRLVMELAPGQVRHGHADD